MKAHVIGDLDMFHDDFEWLIFRKLGGFEPTLMRTGHWKITKINFDNVIEYGICFQDIENNFEGDTILLKSVLCEAVDVIYDSGKRGVTETITATTLEGDRSIQGMLCFCQRPRGKVKK